MYLLLKVRRLDERDLDDCLALLAWAATHGEAVDRERVATAIAALPATADANLAGRRERLVETLRAS